MKKHRRLPLREGLGVESDLTPSPDVLPADAEA
jgi:hypothetical protein